MRDSIPWVAVRQKGHSLVAQADNRNADRRSRRSRTERAAEPGLGHVAAAIAVAVLGGAAVGFGFGRAMDRGGAAAAHASAGSEMAARQETRDGPTPVVAPASPSGRVEPVHVAGRRRSMDPPSAPQSGGTREDAVGPSGKEEGPVQAPAWRRFAAVAPEPAGRPMIAVVIDDVGHNAGASIELARLPAPVTFAMLPYGRELPLLAAALRRAGHELLVHVPMEPGDRAADPGPNALAVDLDESELRRRLDWNLDQFSGFVGISNHMGSRFTGDAGGMAIVMAELDRRGLMFLDSRTSSESMGTSLARWLGVPQAERDIFLDNVRRADNVRAQLRLTERTARRQGYAVAIGHPHAATIEALEAWMSEIDGRGFVLVPISSIARLRLAG